MGRTLPKQLQPMLAALTDGLFDDSGWVLEEVGRHHVSEGYPSPSVGCSRRQSARPVTGTVDLPRMPPGPSGRQANFS